MRRPLWSLGFGLVMLLAMVLSGCAGRGDGGAGWLVVVLLALFEKSAHIEFRDERLRRDLHIVSGHCEGSVEN